MIIIIIIIFFLSLQVLEGSVFKILNVISHFWKLFFSHSNDSIQSALVITFFVGFRELN